jgi:hypothetical protein
VIYRRDAGGFKFQALACALTAVPLQQQGSTIAVSSSVTIFRFYLQNTFLYKKKIKKEPSTTTKGFLLSLST